MVREWVKGGKDFRKAGAGGSDFWVSSSLTAIYEF